MMEFESAGSWLLKTYDPETMNFLQWLNHFEYLVDLTHTENDGKSGLLLSLMNLLANSHILQKVAPYDPHHLPYEVLVSNFEELYGPYQGEWAATYRFLYRDQFEGESILNYIKTLSRIACKVIDFLRNRLSLRVRFVNGLKDDNTRRILRSWNHLTLESAIAIAIQIESTQNSR